MGVTLSTHATLAPISLASTIIGFISFSFTVATFLRVFWENLETIMNANTQVHDVLNNLRIQLYEEKQSLRDLNRHSRDWIRHRHHRSRTRPRLDELTIKAMQSTLHHFSKRFKRLERPFLNTDTIGGRRRYRESFSPVRPYQREAWDAEKGVRLHDRDIHEEEEDPRLQDDEYSHVNLYQRIIWLRHRGEAMALLQGLSRLQTRRIARQIGEISVALYDYGTTIEELDDGVQDIEARLSKVFSIRKVN